MIGAFAVWWLQQMRDMLPARWRRGAAADALIVAAEPAGLTLIRRRRGQERRLGVLPPDAGAADLRRLLPRGAAGRVVLRSETLLLQRDVTLPLAAVAAIGRVLHYEMDRLTPFRSADVVCDWATLRRDAAQGQLHLRLWLLPFAAVQPALEALARLRLTAESVEAATPDGMLRTLRLDRATTGPRTVLRLAAAVCAGLAVLAVALPFVRQSLVSAAVEARIVSLRRPVAEAAALRRTGSAGTDLFAAERARLGDALSTLAAVTDALPDDTFLTEFALRQRRLRLGGQSLAAAALIPRLAADRRFRNPTFTAPVTRSDTGHADLFAIQAELAP